MSPSVLDEIEKCGGAGVSIQDACLICEIAEKDFLASAEAQRRYNIGRLRTEYAVRQSVVELAKKGDARMVKLYFELTRAEGSLTPEEIQEAMRIAEEES